MQAGNPYIAGSPLRDPEGFFGRRDIIDWVSAELSNIHTNALVLYGQRRVGKTTILLQLRHSLSSDKFLPIYFDLQDQAKLRLGEVLANLADSVGGRMNLSEHKPESFDDEGKYFRSVFLPDLYRVLDKESRPVFLLDEFDVLDQGDEGSLENDVASRALFPLLRKVIDDDIRPAFVFVVGRRTEDLRVDFNQMFKTSLTKEVWVLDRLSAETLVRQAEVNGTLKFTQQSIDHILQLTKGHAYLTQLVCQRLWQRAYAGKPVGTPTINVDDVTATISDALEVGDQALIWLWNGLGPAEKIYAAVLAEISDEGKAISEDEVIKVLAEHAARARLRRREVELAPHDLITRHVLELTENWEYIFAIELFRRWVKQKRSLKDVVDEIDKVDPLAQQLFELGQAYYKKHEWSDAVRFFNDALRQNPSHFRANLFLGETFLVMGQTEDAVRQLEIAFSLDSYESQYPLARALIAFAKEKEKNSFDQDALSAAERALAVSPNERLAQDIKKNILERQGDIALKQGDLKAALFAFEKAENAEKVKQVEREYKLKELQILEQEANSFTQKMEWKQAISIYEQLIEKAPDQKSKAIWQSGLEKCKEEEKLESLFTLGLGALTSGDWEQAKKTLSEVVYIRPDYVKDNKFAISLLEQAVSGRKPITFEPIFRSTLFRVFGSMSLLLVVGYLLLSAIQGDPDIETQNSTQAVLMLTDTPAPLALSPAASPVPLVISTDTPSASSVPIIGGADKIAFLNNENIWVMNVDGSDLHAVTNDKTEKFNLEWLPDGKRLLYITGKTIMVVDIETKEQEVITSYGASDYFEAFRISPDGKQVAISLARELHVVPFDLAKLKQTATKDDLINLKGCLHYTAEEVEDIRWSDDGEKLAIKFAASTVRYLKDYIRIIDIQYCDESRSFQLDEFPGSRFTFFTDDIVSYNWNGENREGGNSLFIINSDKRNDGFGRLGIYNSAKYLFYEVFPIEGICCYRDATFSPDGTHVLFAFQDIRLGAEGSIVLYNLPVTSLQTEEYFQPIPLPDGFFVKRSDAPSPVFRTAK